MFDTKQTPSIKSKINDVLVLTKQSQPIIGEANYVALDFNKENFVNFYDREEEYSKYE